MRTYRRLPVLLAATIASIDCAGRSTGHQESFVAAAFSCPGGIRWNMTESQLIAARPGSLRNTSYPENYYEDGLECALFNRAMYTFAHGRLQGIFLRREMADTVEAAQHRAGFVATALAKWGRNPERLLRAHLGLNRSMQHIPLLRWTSSGLNVTIAYTPTRGTGERPFNAEKDPVIEKYASYLELRITGPLYRDNPNAPPPVTPAHVEGAESLFTDLDDLLDAGPLGVEEYLF